MISALQDVIGVPFAGPDRPEHANHRHTGGRDGGQNGSAAFGAATGAAASLSISGIRIGAPDGEAVATAPDMAGAAVFRLSRAAVEQAFGDDSPLATQMRRHRAVSASIRTSLVPADKQSFRAEVRRYLVMTHQSDASFRKALMEGTLVIQTSDEVPELRFQPLIEYVVQGDDGASSHGLYMGAGFNDALYEEMGRTRRQTRGNIGLRQFYAWWPA